MAKIKYNIKLWADTAANLATDTSVYKQNDFIFATDSGVLKKGNGVDAYADIGSIGTVAGWADIAGKPAVIAAGADAAAAWANIVAGAIGVTATTAAAGNHDHAVVADATSGLEAAATLQGLAEALSARIAALDSRVALIEVTP